MKLSFCLITLNEEDNLTRCLESCAGLADDLLVVDSGSQDGTERVARQYGARWVHQDWLGYVGQKNRALDLASSPWVFSLDADEVLSPELQAEVRALKTGPEVTSASGFLVSRVVFYEGRWIRHGDWYPDRLVRLFRRDRARFTGGRVHERLEVAGQVGVLKGELHHYSFRDAEDHRRRCQHYARLWAESRLEAGQGIWPGAPWFHAVARWVRGYIWRRGFLDGRQGWRIARHNAWEAYEKYRLMRRGR
jgi:glycosyltransferase involved in cell wall biosynthesis